MRMHNGMKPVPTVLLVGYIIRIVDDMFHLIWHYHSRKGYCVGIKAKQRVGLTVSRNSLGRRHGGSHR